MPIYNGIEYIQDSVNSIIKQTFKQWELVIGINGHEQNSKVYKKAIIFVNNLKNEHLIENKLTVLDLYEISDKSSALNKMIKYASYDWICLLDVDDKWEKEKLEQQIPYTDKYDVIGTKCKYFGESDFIPILPVGNIKNHDFFSRNPIINSSCLVKKELCKWDLKFNGIEDYKLWLELWKQNKKFYNIDEYLVWHRVHKTSMFNSVDRQQQLIKLKDLKNLIKKKYK